MTDKKIIELIEAKIQALVFDVTGPEGPVGHAMRAERLLDKLADRPHLVSTWLDLRKALTMAMRVRMRIWEAQDRENEAAFMARYNRSPVR